jgi:predicted secreted protein
VKKYHELKQNLLEAQVSQQLESENRGERFSLIEPAFVPSAPDSPNRIRILLVGVVLSMISGLGFASVAEYLDQSVRGARRVSQLLGAPPIVSIPYLVVESGEARLDQRRIMLTGLVILTVLILGLLMIQLFWSGQS